MLINPHTTRIQDHATILADWLEYEAMRSSNGVGSLLELARQLNIAGSGDAEEDYPRDFTSHPKLDEVMSELEARDRASGEGYPFIIDDSGQAITRKEKWQDYIYTKLLLISFINCEKAVKCTSRSIFPARLFEAISVVAAQEYLGGKDAGAMAYHFGAPRPDNSGFTDALKELEKLTRGKQLGIIEPAKEKDGGLDVFAWRPFPDSRCNFICLFGQCATGNDWPQKNPEPKQFMDIWLRVETTSVTPTLFVPFTLTKEEWTKKSRTLVILDRCRIAALVPKVKDISTHDLVSELITTLLAA